jgi:PAS domain-containing protein
MSRIDWVREFPAEVTVCDCQGTLLEMNWAAEALFCEDGGRGLLGANILECHPDTARIKLANLMKSPAANAYFETEHGKKRFYFQSPWYRDGSYAGFVEISFGVSPKIPHFIRE